MMPADTSVLKLAVVVAIGSAVGGVLRFWTTAWIARVLPTHLPLGTLLVNVSGSFAIGVVAALFLGRWQASTATVWPPLLMTGLLGGFTTFSAFSLQTLLLMHQGRWLAATTNVALSLVLCLGAVWLGWQLAMPHRA
jgi:fluoride exporter